MINWQTIWGLVFVVAVFWSLHVAGVFQGELVNDGGWTLVFQFLGAILSPDMSPEFLLLTLDATLKTLAYAVCGTFFCMAIGLVGGVLCSQVWWLVSFRGFQTPWLLMRGILAIPRAIHELIWGLFFVNIFGLDPLVAVLAIAIPFGAVVAKVFSEILDETPRQPLLALINSGVPPLNAFAYSLIPQAFPNLLSYSFYRLECSIRSAAVLGIIGAGGLGDQILLSLQSLRYKQMWTLMFALMLLSGGTDFLSAFLRKRLDIPSRMDLNVLNLKQRHNRKQHDPLVRLVLLSGVALLIFSFWYVQADFTKLWSPRTAQLLVRVIQDAFPPQWVDLNQLFALSTQTIAMSILAMTCASLGGILLSFLCARRIGRKRDAENFPPLATPDSSRGGFDRIFRLPLRLYGRVLTKLCLDLLRIWIKPAPTTRFLLLFARAVPEPIWALIFLFVLFPGILPGAFALGLHNMGIVGRLMAEVVENLDERPLLSLKAIGASRFQVFLYGVLPLTLPRFLAYVLYRWENCIRATVIVGLVGAGGLGRLITEQLSSFDYKALLTTLLVLIGITLAVDLISTSVRASLR